MSSTPGANGNAGDGDKKPKLTKGQKKANRQKAKRAAGKGEAGKDAAEKGAAENDAAGAPGPAPGPSAVPSTEKSSQESANSKAGGLNEAMEKISLANGEGEADARKKKERKAKDDGHVSNSEESAEQPTRYQPSYDVIDPDERETDNSFPADQMEDPTPVPENVNKLKTALYDVRGAFSDKAKDDIADHDREDGLYARRRGFGKGKDEEHLQVYTNHFKIDFRKPGSGVEGHFLYEYSVEGIKAEHTRGKKKTLMKALFSACSMLNRAEKFCVTDWVSKIVSWVDLSLFHENETGLLAEPGNLMAVCQVPDYDKRTHQSNKDLELKLNYVRKINMRALEEYTKGNRPKCDDENEAVGAMNLFFSKHIFSPDQSNFQAGSNRFFVKGGWERFLGRGDDGNAAPGKVMIRGYSYRVRPAMGQLLLNVNTARGLFYDDWTVADYLGEYNNDPADLIGLRVLLDLRRVARDADGEELEEETNALNTAKAITKTIYEIGTLVASKQFAYRQGTKDVTVWEHMDKNYNGKVDLEKTSGNAGSFCINTNPKDSPTKAWFLADDLIILPYQAYKRKLDGDLTSLVIEKACKPPSDNLRAIIQEGIPAIGSTASQKDSELPDPFIQFGIKIDPRLVSVPARQIQRPKLRFQYPPSFTIPDRTLGQWQFMPGWKFLTNDQAVTGRPFFLIPHGFQANTLDDFWSHYARPGTPPLGDLPPTFNGSNSRTIHGMDNIEQAVADAVKTKPSIVIMILKDKNKTYLSWYALFKSLMDQNYGLPSLCLSLKKLRDKNKFKDGKPLPADEKSNVANYAYNVGMKLNIRLGNTNHSIESTNFDVLPKDTNDNCDTLILGADVVHPGVSSVDGTPSIAALVGSVDGDFAKYLGSMRKQKYVKGTMSTEIIDSQNMRAMARERLQAWHEVNNRYPSHILYYRDGVGDSQFDDVVNKEVEAIRDAYTDVVQKTPQANSSPKISAVVVVKRHNTRLYPTPNGSKSKTGNCQPGTVVDSSITHPHNFDFFLTSHDALQGTARPTHYTVLLNEMAFSATGIQDLTHKLCYTYQRSTTSVSYVPPAYYADHLCERGRCYLMEFFEGGIGLRGGRRSRWSRG